MVSGSCASVAHRVWKRRSEKEEKPKEKERFPVTRRGSLASERDWAVLTSNTSRRQSLTDLLRSPLLSQLDSRSRCCKVQPRSCALYRASDLSCSPPPTSSQTLPLLSFPFTRNDAPSTLTSVSATRTEPDTLARSRDGGQSAFCRFPRSKLGAVILDITASSALPHTPTASRDVLFGIGECLRSCAGNRVDGGACRGSRLDE